MPGDDFGKAHVTIGGEPPADQRITDCWVLVAVMESGAEGVYSQTIGKHLHNFVATEPGMKDVLEDYLRERGSIEVARREGIRLEWRHFSPDGDPVEIT
jgi:hypothetical protein